MANQANTEILRAALTRYWGFGSFLPLQEEASACVLNGRDSVVVLPTGGGKSLCFQAPAAVLPGIAVVVTPLISLMKDQVEGLRECGVPAAFINSTQSPSEQRAIAEEIRAGQVKLVYVAPERLVTPRFIEFLSSVSVSFIAVDEAHCISMWGHDFRPEYRQLRVLREALPNLAIHAYTATATAHVRDDICTELFLREPEVLVGAFDRPNLVYSAQRRTHGLAQICAVLDRHRGDSGIIYCIRRADVDALSAALSVRGYRALPYHAGMDDLERKRNQEAFTQEQTDIIVATVAFGMGIDKSNVRFVIHAGMPKSIEHYQQETGRAGRDGLEAECLLLHSYSDYAIWRSVLGNQGDDPEAAQVALRKLDVMYNFCTATGCRHKALVEYFGQTLDKDNCGACDMCLGEYDAVDDALVVAQKILSCVVRLGERYGAHYTSLVLAGANEERVLSRGHDALSTFGILSERRRGEVRDWIEQLVAQDYLQKTGEYGVLQVTPAGRGVLRGEATPRLLRPAGPTKKTAKSKVSKESWKGVDRGLFEALRALRREQAEQRGVPPFVVFSDASLRDMARRRPSSLEELLRVHGVGKKKSRDYGELFLEAIHEYCEADSIDLDAAEHVPPSKTAPGDGKPRISRARMRQQAAFNMFAQGCAIEEVMETLARSRSWVCEKLALFLDAEKRTSPAPWVDDATFARVRAAANRTGTDRLKPIYLLLDEEVSYDDIRLALACLATDEIPQC